MESTRTSQTDTGRPSHCTSSFHNPGTRSRQSNEADTGKHYTWSILHNPGLWQSSKAETSRHSHHSSRLHNPGTGSRQSSEARTGKYSRQAYITPDQGRASWKRQTDPAIALQAYITLAPGAGRATRQTCGHGHSTSSLHALGAGQSGEADTWQTWTLQFKLT